MREELERGDSSTERTTLDGAWLRRERERIAIGRRQVADRLGLPESQVIRVEMNRRPVPPSWYAALAELGFPVPAEALQAGAKTESPMETMISLPVTADVAPPVASPSTASAAASRAGGEDCADLLALIVNFRLAYGRRTQQPPAETLARIVADLRESGADCAITHDDLERAARCLLHPQRAAIRS